MKRALWLVLALVLAAGFVRGSAVSAAPFNEGTENLPAGATDSVVLSNMESPIAMAFAPDGRLFYTEKTGQVRVIANGALQAAPVIAFEVVSGGEQGLLGITLDPDFADNHYIYVYYTESGAADNLNKVVRFVESGGSGSGATTIFTSLDRTSASNHNGGNIHFGPDGKLYVSIGDDGDRPANSQDVRVKNGKIHRLNPDGSIPADNPVFTGTDAIKSIYAMGLRNSFDFSFDPVNGDLWASENGPGCDDELNHILPGGNYGWRTNYPCEDGNPSPTYNTIPAEWWLPQGDCCLAPTGAEFYSGNLLAGWQNTLLMCDYNSGHMRHFTLSADRQHVTGVNVINNITCNMDVQTAPDGSLYYMAGGGYSPGTLHRITGPNQPTVTPAQATAIATATSGTQPTATSTTAPTPLPQVTPRPTQAGELISTADPLFYKVWERVDRPVLELKSDRSWTWGPKGGAALQEQYGEGTRLVQYFDKARMELNPASGGQAAYVTNGLLVVEMISGRIQVGPENYRDVAPSTVPIGGDGTNNPAPSYSVLAGVASLAGDHQASDMKGDLVTAGLASNGAVTANAQPTGSNVRLAGFVAETGHNIPDVFWNFLNARGIVYEDGQYKDGQVLDWVFTVGYPLTEPYWTEMAIAGKVEKVMVQAYQRQVLTYIPSYDEPWRVQFGNVAQHYFSWRYGGPR